MIKVNLAKGGIASEAQSKSDGKFNFSGFGSSKNKAIGGDTVFISKDLIQRRGLVNLLMILMGPMMLYAYELITIPTKVAALNLKRTEFQELQTFNLKADDAVKEITKFTEEQNKVQQRIQALNLLTRERLFEIRILDLFQQNVPEKLWFTQVVTDSEKIVIHGLAMNDNEVNVFTDKLQQSAFFRNVELVSSLEEKIDNFNLKKFEISCLLKTDMIKKTEVN